MSLRGFGTTYDLETGRARNWYVGADGVKRWADNDEPTDPVTATAWPYGEVK